jgi:tRNA threonylcarbamoyladenosine biosynthesis protein TsaB
MLSERGLTLADCDAVCVSMGPGSYTGLRVGVSTAKGLCFGSGKPLLAVGTLDTLVAQAAGEAEAADSTAVAGKAGAADVTGQYRYIIPMIDARRMEVYTAVFEPSAILSDPSVILSDSEGSLPYIQITETAPAIIDENSFAKELEDGPVLFIGDGAGKCADVIKHPNAHFCQCHPKASSMLSPALAALRAGDFKDVAYFEPFYLKEFVATVSKKKLF